MRRTLIRVFSLLFLLQTIAPPTLAAEQLQLQAPDVEPPKIEFEQGGTEIEAGIKTFSATVTDNVGVANVTLYVKDANDIAFRPITMNPSTGDPDVYSVELSLDPVVSDKIEIYIRADDVSGNSIFEGQKFSPLTFTVVPMITDAVVSEEATEPEKPEKKKKGMSTMTKVLIGLGVAALIASAGGGDDDDDDEGTVTITTDLPD